MQGLSHDGHGSEDMVLVRDSGLDDFQRHFTRAWTDVVQVMPDAAA